MSAGDQAVGERFLASGVEERELVMIQTQLMKNGCVQIGNGDPICHDLVAKVIGDPMDMARFEAAACEPNRAGVTIMVATALALRNGQSAEFPAPQHNGAVQEAAIFEVLDQRRGGQIG